MCLQNLFMHLVEDRKIRYYLKVYLRKEGEKDEKSLGDSHLFLSLPRTPSLVLCLSYPTQNLLCLSCPKIMICITKLLKHICSLLPLPTFSQFLTLKELYRRLQSNTFLLQLPRIDRIREWWWNMHAPQLWDSKKSVLWKAWESMGLAIRNSSDKIALFQTQGSVNVNESLWRRRTGSLVEAFTRLTDVHRETDWQLGVSGRLLFKSERHIIYIFPYLKTRCILNVKILKNILTYLLHLLFPFICTRVIHNKSVFKWIWPSWFYKNKTKILNNHKIYSLIYWQIFLSHWQLK